MKNDKAIREHYWLQGYNAALEQAFKDAVTGRTSYVRRRDVPRDVKKRLDRGA